MVDTSGQTSPFKSPIGNQGVRSDWQMAAWDMLDAVGELRYYVSWRATSSSRVKLLASELSPDGAPTGECENDRVNEIVNAIAGGALGQAQFQKRAVECLTVVGECWIAIIAGYASDGTDTWLVLTKDEIQTSSNVITVSLPDGTRHPIEAGTDTLFRVWNPHPRWASIPDSPVRACLDPLREIVRTTKTISNASKSRLIGNGVVFVPHEMSLPAANSPITDGNIGASLTGAPAVQQLQELLFQVAQTAYDDEDSMAALIPMFAGVPGDQVKNVSHLKFDNSVTDIAIKTRNDAIARLAMGLDVSPERLLGLGKHSNHWTAWNISDDDVKLHIIPPMELLCSALASQVLTPMLEREGIDPSLYTVWHDPSALTADPDLTASATNAYDRGVITADNYREFLRLGDTGYDLTTLEGWEEWARDRVAVNPLLLPDLMPLLPELSGKVNLPTTAPAPLPAAPVPYPEPKVTPEPKAPPMTPDKPVNNPPGLVSSADSRSLAEVAVVEVLVGRALELAGKRRRTRADYERLRDVPMHETHRYMEPVDDAAVADLIRGWDAALEEDTLAHLNVDSDYIRSAVKAAVRRELTREVVNL